MITQHQKIRTIISGALVALAFIFTTNVQAGTLTPLHTTAISDTGKMDKMAKQDKMGKMEKKKAVKPAKKKADKMAKDPASKM